MKKLDGKTDGKTMDIVAKNMDKIKELFPEVFTENKVNFDALKEALGEYVDDRDERYNFTWNGKSKAKMIAQTPSTGTLRPCKQESVDWDSTQNIFIEGDNLEVLKLLQKSYHKKVKMIYIDPPYNTGKDFVYKDNFKDNIKNYKEITGQVDGEGRNLSNNPETSGRYHTDWLNMMYPRLKLARNLLKDDGVIFISIDDNEAANLRKICDEIFGEENFVSILSIENNPKGRKNGKFISITNEYCLIYVKDIQLASFQKIIPKHAADMTEDENGDFVRKSGKRVLMGENTLNRLVSDFKSPKHYSAYIKKSVLILKQEETVNDIDNELIELDYSRYVTFRDGNFVENTYTKEKFQNLFDDESLDIRNNKIYEKHFSDMMQIKSMLINNEYEAITDNRKFRYKIDLKSTSAKQQLTELLCGEYFNFPKNIIFIKHLISLQKNTSDIILDFFAGSATTAHAVFELNAEQNLKRRIFLVQIPEPIKYDSEAFVAGYKTIAEISKERIRRAATKIKKENPDYDGDLGFKVFKLDSTNIKPWEVDFDLDDKRLEYFVENIKPDRREEDVLYEILLKYGLDLALPITEQNIAGKKVFSINNGALIICLSDSICIEVISGIAKLKDELKPETMRVVFKDSSFTDDVVKTNAVQILKQAGIVDVRSV